MNNLRGVDVDIPKRTLVVSSGVSGSGTSSLTFDTVAAEFQWMLDETYLAFVQNLMPHRGRSPVGRRPRLGHVAAQLPNTLCRWCREPVSLRASHGTLSMPMMGDIERRYRDVGQS